MCMFWSEIQAISCAHFVSGVHDVHNVHLMCTFVAQICVHDVHVHMMCTLLDTRTHVSSTSCTQCAHHVRITRVMCTICAHACVHYNQYVYMMCTLVQLEHVHVHIMCTLCAHLQAICAHSQCNSLLNVYIRLDIGTGCAHVTVDVHM
jgi:hypothetical protein